MKHENAVQFKTAKADAAGLSMLDAIAAAKSGILAMTGLEIDAVVRCAKDAEDTWQISVDVIESPARMGDNDLLTTYELHIDRNADLVNYNRLRRYHREDRDG